MLDTTFPHKDMSVRDKTIGRITHVGIIKVDVSLKWYDGSAETIDHEKVDGYWRFSIMGSVWRRINSNDCESCGQIIGTVRQLDNDLSRRIVKLWREWHLNDMKMGCADQGKASKLPNGSLDLASVPPCENTGYRFGSAWLLRVIPDDVINEMRALIAELKDI